MFAPIGIKTGHSRFRRESVLGNVRECSVPRHPRFHALSCTDAGTFERECPRMFASATAPIDVSVGSGNVRWSNIPAFRGICAGEGPFRGHLDTSCSDRECSVDFGIGRRIFPLPVGFSWN